MTHTHFGYRIETIMTQRLIIVGSKVQAHRAAAHAVALSAVMDAASGGARSGEPSTQPVQVAA